MNTFDILTALSAYLIGAFPTGYIIAQYKGIADIRAHGSGNIGATNVARTLGIRYFFPIFLIDAGKAFTFIYAMQPYYSLEYLCVFAGIVLLGNRYSLFLQGSGGKGVATLCGLLIALSPLSAIFLFCIWISIVALTHTVGIASVVTALCLPLYMYTMHNTTLFTFAIFATLWIIYTHRTNIQAFYEKMREYGKVT
jgi:glycerol-3-phosphate acyltransferase PlsY